jgi:hypothetical protein
MGVAEMFEEIGVGVSGLSVDQMIREYVRLDKKVKEAAKERADYHAALLERAEMARNGQNTVHLETADESQKVKVEFKTELAIIDQSEIEMVKELLSDEKFNELFGTTYKPKARTLKTFLNSVSANERTETARQVISEVVKTVAKTPYMSVERG